MKIIVNTVDSESISNNCVLTSVSVYVEPIFPIQKRKRFNEDNMKPLLNDDDCNFMDRNHLKEYNKHRVSGGQVNTSYQFAGGACSDFQLGRLFVVDGLGIQSFRFDIRNPLVAKYYFDTDVENCHFIIALKFCIDNDLKHEKLLYYILNRKNCLKMISKNQKRQKLNS